MNDLQKAGMWKRISAALFDVILLVIAAVGIALLLSVVLGYDRQSDAFEDRRSAFEAQYGVDFDIEAEELAALSKEEQDLYNTAWEAFAKDEEANRAYGTMMNLVLIIITFGLLGAFLILEFLIPLLFKNGQTLGKKIFALGVMREDRIVLSPVLLFIRTILGKYTVETMLPVFILIMLAFGTMSFVGVIALFALLILQIALIALTPARTPLHDKLAHTVTVDMASQRIFESVEAREEYRRRVLEERRGD